MKNHKFLKDLSSKFSRFYVFICMVIKRWKVFFENFGDKKLAYVRIYPQIY